MAIVGSGDPNVYALAGLALEILESKGATASMVDFEVVPGVPVVWGASGRTAGQRHRLDLAVRSSGGDAEIESRLHAAAKEKFTIAIYNPGVASVAKLPEVL